MQRLTQPEAIPVMTPPRQPENGVITTVTDFYREGVYLPSVLEYLKKHVAPGPRASVVVAACSSFAEGDSVLSIANKHDLYESIDILGLDFNRRALEAAKAGKYRLLNRNRLGPVDIGAGINALEEYGFDVSGKKTGRDYDVDAAPVRARHQVGFACADLTEEQAAPSLKADLVLANNFLYYHMPKASRIMPNLMNMLNDHGVISFGKTFHPKYRSVWRRVAQDALLKGGFKPAIIGPEGHLVAFARSNLHR